MNLKKKHVRFHFVMMVQPVVLISIIPRHCDIAVVPAHLLKRYNQQLINVMMIMNITQISICRGRTKCLIPNK